jgi:hypothetical protein
MSIIYGFGPKHFAVGSPGRQLSHVPSPMFRMACDIVNHCLIATMMEGCLEVDLMLSHVALGKVI